MPRLDEGDPLLPAPRRGDAVYAITGIAETAMYASSGNPPENEIANGLGHENSVLSGLAVAAR